MQPSEILTVIAIAKREAAKVVKDETVPAIAPKGDKGDKGDAGPQGIDGKDGINGTNGRDGIDGQDGTNGLNGRDGVDGVDGVDGKDGTRGKDGANGANGVSIRDVYVDPDEGNLYVELTNSRIINAGPVKGKDGKDGKDGKNGFMAVGGGSLIASGGGGGLTASFETVAANLDASGAVFAYTGGELTGITYANGVRKAFAYGPDGLASVTLSGSLPSGINLVKTFIYTAGELAGVSYT